MDRRICLMRSGDPVDTGYSTVREFVPAGSRAARLVEARPREVFDNAAPVAEMPVVFEVYYDSLTRRIDETWRLEYQGREYGISGVSEIGRREGVRIVADRMKQNGMPQP
jgi:hypothetical protein